MSETATIPAARSIDKTEIEKHIVAIPDFPKKGILFYDITPIMLAPEIYEHVVDIMAQSVKKHNPTKILAAEARGFFFGPQIALKLKLPFVPVRKRGKLPRETLDVEYALEYGTDFVSVHRADINASDRLVILDDILATGGTADAMCRMAKIAGAKIACCAFFMELGFLHGRQKLAEYPVESVFVK